MNSHEPLGSWKEIGAYLQRDARTARRWEKEEACQSIGILIRAGAASMPIRARSMSGGLGGG